MTDGTIVYVQDDSQGTIHKRVQIGKSLASPEGCNADSSGSFTVLTNGIGDARKPFRECRRCFPPDDAADEGAVPV